jgi:hypothetical protein
MKNILKMINNVQPSTWRFITKFSVGLLGGVFVSIGIRALADSFDNDDKDIHDLDYFLTGFFSDVGASVVGIGVMQGVGFILDNCGNCREFPLPGLRRSEDSFKNYHPIGDFAKKEPTCTKAKATLFFASGLIGVGIGHLFRVLYSDSNGPDKDFEAQPVTVVGVGSDVVTTAASLVVFKGAIPLLKRCGLFKSESSHTSSLFPVNDGLANYGTENNHNVTSSTSFSSKLMP